MRQSSRKPKGMSSATRKRRRQTPAYTGSTFAAIHNAVDDFSSSHPRFHLDLDHFIDTPMRRIQPFLADHPEKYEYIRDFALRVKAKILALPADELEYGFCHGDFQGGHAYLAPDDTFTFFDFDCCGLGYRAYDLAVFRWAARLSDKEDLWWEPYIEAYQQVRAAQAAGPGSHPPVRLLPLPVAYGRACSEYLRMGLGKSGREVFQQADRIH